MRDLCFLSIVLTTTGAALTAQGVTSPKGYDNIEGVSCSSHPFTQPRYAQIHTDVTGKHLFKSLNHRQDGQCTSAGKKAIDLEIVMAHSSAASASKTFAANYKTPVQVVFKRRKLNTPDWKAPTQAPHPWNWKLMFDAPFAYDSSKGDLLWESRLYNPKNSSNLWSDYHFTLSSKRNVASWKAIGAGCTAKGRTSPMTHKSLVRTELRSNVSTLVFWTQTTNAPANAVSAVLIGTQNPAAPVPGLCTKLYTDAVAILEAKSSPTGIIDTSSTTVPFDKNWVGQKLYSQAASVDVGRNDPLQVAASNGLELTLWDLSPDVKMVRLLGFTSATQKDGLLVTNTGVVVVQFGT